MSTYVVQCSICAATHLPFRATFREREEPTAPAWVDRQRAAFDRHNGEAHGGVATLLVTRDGKEWQP